ncbi:S8 family serine peptidase [Microbacterium aurum]
MSAAKSRASSRRRRTPSGGRSPARAARSRPRCSRPTTASRPRCPSTRSTPSRRCPASSRCTPCAPTPSTTPSPCRSWGCPRCGRTPATPARTSRSRSSTRASTTRTPPSAAPARPRPTRRRTRRRPSPPTRPWFGPDAPRVKGGIDLVGDDYNADSSSDDYQPVPHPDDNPLDCNGHGSHVAGTTGGSGVLADGTTYPGPYDESTPSNTFRVGPGVAPQVDLYAVRVFGCEGSTDVVVPALDWAVEHGMDVVNLSLGSSLRAWR